jgi:hypothetical protein
MAHYFIYTTSGPYHPSGNCFNTSALKHYAPSGKFHYGETDVNSIGRLINDAQLWYASVVEIQEPAEAVAFKMMQNEFLLKQDNKRKQGTLVLVLENPDWAAIYAEGPNITDLIKQKEAQSNNVSLVNAMVRKSRKLEDEHKKARLIVSHGLDDRLKEYLATMNKAVEQFRDGNKLVTSQLTNERKRVKKKLLSYAIFKAK